MHIHRITFVRHPGGDAEVEVVAGDMNCIAFASPFTGAVGQRVTEPLHVFGLRHAMLTDRETLGIWRRDPSGLDQIVVADVADASGSLLKVGGIALKVDEALPGGLADGDRIAFECARIDLWWPPMEQVKVHSIEPSRGQEDVRCSMTDDVNTLQTALAQTELRLQAAPDFQPLRSIAAPINYLLDLHEGRSTDHSRLGEIIIGVYAAREFESRDMAYASLLYEVEDVVKSLRETTA